MAKLKAVIERVDDIKPNAFSNAAKTEWINEVEGMVQTEVMLIAIDDVVTYEYEADKTHDLLVPAPHDKIYWTYLSAMIDFANGEYNRYQNTMQLFNQVFGEYMRWYARIYRPADQEAEWRGYYISAYGIAVKHGYVGTEEEWLETLKGEDGEPGEKVEIRYSSEANELQSKYESNEEWETLMSLAELQGTVVSETLAEAEEAVSAATSAAENAGSAAVSASASAEAAEESAASVEGIVEAAEAAAEAAQTAAGNASAYATNAAGSAESAEASAGTASTAAQTASASASAAEESEQNAADSETAAESAASDAQSAATSAQGSATAAAQSAAGIASAVTAAQAAATNASTSAATASQAAESVEGVVEAAEAAAENAESSATTASQAATTAQSAATTAQTAAASAGASAESAEESETAAGNAKTAAQTAAGTAQTAATTAQTAAGNALTSEQNAADSAEDAETAAESAGASASAAAQSAASITGAVAAAQAAATSASASAAAAAESAQTVDEEALLAESWAVGNTGSREGENTNNAKYWSDVAQGAAGGGVSSFNGRSGAVAPQSGDYTAEMVGAEEAGAAAEVQDNLETHASSTSHITASERTTWNGKQSAISDIATIRSGAALGATAVQPGELTEVATSGNYNDLSNKPSIPDELADLAQDSTHRTVTDAEKATWNAKQNAISDIATIRSGAALGATAVQPSAIADMATKTWVNGQGYASGSNVTAIEGKIPSQASPTNQLADKEFVNSSIQNIAAFYVTKNAAGDPFATKAELNAATVFYSGGEIYTPSRNDYLVVLADESKTITETGENPTTRYIYDNGWSYQYIVNRSGLTAVQWTAVNSGITAAKVSGYDGHLTNNTIHVTSSEKTVWNAKQSALTFDATPTSGSTNPVTSGGIKNALDGKETSGAAETVQGNLDTHTGNSTIHVTASDKTAWNEKAPAYAPYFTITSATTLSATHYGAYVMANGTFTITLPTASSSTAGVEIEIHNIGTGTITIRGAFRVGGTAYGTTKSITLDTDDAVTVKCIGTGNGSWTVIGNYEEV